MSNTSSGGKIMVINTAERAVSVDVNRQQAFVRKDMLEVYRWLFDVGLGTDDNDAGGLQQEHLTVETPLRAEVLGGLMVQPAVGSLAVTVSDGALMTISPDTSPSSDDSPYKLVRDPGSAVDGITLAMTGNVSGQTRIDIIECQRTESVVETDSRDIFNPITGLFSATTVTKAIESTLTYRVRLGTSGAGFPGLVSGWLPLVVASVPNATTTNDTITFWDVRPMLSDRWPSIQSAPNNRPRQISHSVNGDDASVFAATYDVALKGRRLGGQIRRGTPGADGALFPMVNLTDVVNQDPNAAAIANGALWHLWLATPFGLPRWARYTDATTGSRVPRSPRGILFVSPSVPGTDGNVRVADRPTLPLSLGFGTVNLEVGDAVALGGGTWTTSGGAKPKGFYGSSQGDYPADGGPNPPAVVSPSNVVTFTLTAGTHFPTMAREILVSVTVSINHGGSVPGLAAFIGTMSTSNDPTSQIFEFFQNYTFVGANEGRVVTFWMPVDSLEPLSTDPATHTLVFSCGGGSETVTSPRATVIGWKF